MTMTWYKFVHFILGPMLAVLYASAVGGWTLWKERER